MNKIYLLLGSNMGNSKKKIVTAQKHIAQKIGSIVRKSSLYETAAWGKTDQPDFLNQVVVVISDLNASDCIDEILAIEQLMGRIRTEKNAARIIDIDILFFNKEIIKSKKLSVPHPAIQDRRFVLVPLNELSPNFVHPVHQQTIHSLLVKCVDKLNVKKI